MYITSQSELQHGLQTVYPAASNTGPTCFLIQLLCL